MRRLRITVHIAFRQMRIEITNELFDVRELHVEIIKSKNETETVVCLPLVKNVLIFWRLRGCGSKPGLTSACYLGRSCCCCSLCILGLSGFESPKISNHIFVYTTQTLHLQACSRYPIFPIVWIHSTELLLQGGKLFFCLFYDEVQLSIFGKIFVKFSLILATLFNRCNRRVITARKSWHWNHLHVLKMSRLTHLKLPFVDPFFERFSRKPLSPLPALSYELLVVFCVTPFVRLPLRWARSMLLLLPLMLFFDCPPLIGDAIRLLIGSVAITV